MVDVGRLCGRVTWRSALWYALPAVSILLGLFYYWFALADRYAVFLYEHLGATPFDRVTRSRYWMSGLVACGVVMVLYVSANWVLGRLAVRRGDHHTPPEWWRVWALCAGPLLLAIPLITMTQNQPTLPLSLALACVLATLAGLALALMPGQWAAQRPVDLAWLAWDGAGLVPVLQLLWALELPSRGVTSRPVALAASLGGLLFSAIWLLGVSWLRSRRRRPAPSAISFYLAGLCLAYLFMPLLHHLAATPPGYRYITIAGNFIAHSPGLQAFTLVVAGLLSWAFTRVRHRWGNL